MPKRFEELIAQGEGISVEFKECKDSLPKSIFETLCSFLNCFDGDSFQCGERIGRSKSFFNP